MFLWKVHTVFIFINDLDADSFIKRLRDSQRSATITNHSSSQTPIGRGNRQNQTSANRTNVRKALRLALSSPSEVITMQKWTEQHKNKITQCKT